jgi:hypothetical protein
MDEDEDDWDGYLDTPNCPKCLEPMEPVVGAWWCESCGIAVRPES